MAGPWEKYAAPTEQGPWSKYASTPQKENPQQGADASGFKLGETASAFARPVLEGLGGLLTAIPDLATQIGNLVPGLGPQVTPPGEDLQKLIDKYTTAPTDTLGKAGEFVNSTLVGALGGPKAPKLPAKMAEGARELAERGVTMTPGQRRGGIANAAEQVIAGVPVLGEPVKAARAKSVEQWNIAHLNEALKDAGGKAVAAGVKGRDAIRHTYQELQRRYGEVLGKMKGDLHSTNTPPGSAVAAPGQVSSQPGAGSFGQVLDRVRDLSKNLEPKHQKMIEDIIDNKIRTKFTAHGVTSGEKIKEMDELLRTEGESLRRGDYQDRKAALAMDAIHEELRAMVKRENPELAPQLEAIDKGYAKYKTAAKASNYAKKSGGTYTPTQRTQAIAARDKSKDKNKFSTGAAFGQKEAETAEKVLGNTVPDSGTAGRMALLETLLAGPGAIAGHPVAAAGAAAAPLLYSQPVLKFLQDRAMKGGPGLVSPIGAFAGGQQDVFGAQQ